MTEIDWNLSRVFLAALAESSLSGAARVLDMAQPTVSRQIAQFEQQLGMTLFTRSPRGLQPTSEAWLLEPHARAMAAAAAGLSRAASGDRDPASGVVRVSASEVVGAEVLPAMLAVFRRTHPHMVIELSLANQQEDLLGGEVDLAVRMVRPTQDPLIARRIGSVGIGLYAHRDYLAGRTVPDSFAALKQHALIGFEQASAFQRRIMDRLPLTREDFSLRCDSDLAQVAAVRAGFGIGFVQHPLAARSSGLLPIMPESIGFELPVWLAIHENHRRTTRVQILFESLATDLTRYVS